jgi:two-component system, chemotaxis family, protein-glutamate methylesterase/glutaminase
VVVAGPTTGWYPCADALRGSPPLVVVPWPGLRWGNPRVSRQATEPGAQRTVVVASSAGGLAALLVVLPELPADFPAPVICVQHLAPRHPSYLAEILSRRCALEIRVVEGRCRPAAGTVLLAPPDHHVRVEPDGWVGLSEESKVNYVRPSADLLFESAAEVLGARTIAVVLTGSGHDGAAGALAVQQAGGTVVVQSPESCEFAAMVESTMELLKPDLVVPLPQLAQALQQLVEEVAA